MTDSNFKCLAVEDVDENRSLLARPSARIVDGEYVAQGDRRNVTTLP